MCQKKRNENLSLMVAVDEQIGCLFEREPQPNRLHAEV